MTTTDDKPAKRRRSGSGGGAADADGTTARKRERAGSDGDAGARASRVATPWGAGRLVDEVELPQEADGREFAALVQLLELPDGERLVRFAYTTGGVARRGPVSLRRRDLKRLRRELTRHDDLRTALDP